MAATKREYYITGDNDHSSIFDVYQQAQTFTIGNVGADEDMDITSVIIKIFKLGHPATLTLEIQDVDGNNKPDGNVLSTGSIGDADVGTNATWEEISMSSATLNFNTQYALVLSSPAGDTNNKFWWRVDTSSATYGGGNYLASADSGSSWTAVSTWDFMFEIWGETAAVVLNPKVKVSGTFSTKKTLVKIGGSFAEKPVLVKVGGAFQ